MRKFLLPVVLLFLLLCGFAAAGYDITQSQFVIEPIKYPERHIDMIVPFSAGGGGGIVGWNDLVTAKPDGYTVGIATTELLMQPMFGDLKYHYLTALEPIAQVSSTPFIFIVNAAAPWNTLDDLVAYAKQYPREVTYAHGGCGSVDHVLNEKFAQTANIQLSAVPFQGGGEVIAALLGEHVEFALVNPATAIEHLKAGTVKALASTGKQRSTHPVLTHIPTLGELGYDMNFTVWYGVAAPKEMPKEIRNILSGAFAKLANDPAFQKSAEMLGMETDYLPAEEFKAKWLYESKKLSKMLQETGIAEHIKEHKR